LTYSGPAIGGMILGAASWRWIFFVNLPIGIIGTIMVWTLFRHIVRVCKKDLTFGGCYYFYWAACPAFMVDHRSIFGYAICMFWDFLRVFIALLLFVQLEKRVTHPMIDLTIFRNPFFQ
jgi:hypothetical protein